MKNHKEIIRASWETNVDDFPPKTNWTDRHEARRQALIDAIPSRVNRAGRYYRKLIKEIYVQ
jgi:hypothetical protein